MTYQIRGTDGYELIVFDTRAEVRNLGQVVFTGTFESCERWLKERGVRLWTH